ncbi:MAG TPA: SAM-dependent methyltransferase [Streptosporangiaceae bacterium]|nr:SAM-dependent methyltransferase [Streptosporangiaceae bacterium]
MAESDEAPEGVEADRPSIARVYDFLLGGHHNYAADRELARRILEAEPNARHVVAENRQFLGRAVNYMVQAGISQFIDLGSGIPTQENVHEIAQRSDPEARIVYVDNDASVFAHSRHLLRGNPLAAVINADMRKPAAILAHPEVRRLIDFSQPVGLLMFTVLHFVPDSQDAYGIMAAYTQALAPGSYLAVSHATSDPLPDTAKRVEELSKSSSTTAYIRTAEEIGRFFAGYELMEPGLVYMPLWRHDDQVPDRPELVWLYAGVGRKLS